MSNSKQDVVDMLFELAELTAIDEGDVQSFRVRAYQNAGHAISAYGPDLAGMTVRELEQIPHVGKATAEKILEQLTTGRVAKLDALRAKHPPGVLAVMRIPGVGPKALSRLRSELGVQSIEDLRRALAEGKLRKLGGFGIKSEERLLASLARLDAEGAIKRTPLGSALRVAGKIARNLEATPGADRVVVCGSVRRFLETIGDIDIVVATAEPDRIMTAVVDDPTVTEVLARGESKSSVIASTGIQVDVRVVTRDQLGAALIYFTGSKAHNIQLRQRALARGLTLSEYALEQQDTGSTVASETEEEVYGALGLPWIPPVLREGAGEIEAAAAGTLPQPIGKLSGDFHVHTTLSPDGRSTLREMAVAAIDRDYSVLAITDHAEGSRYGATREALLEQRAEIRALQSELGDRLRILHGIELNIGPSGELDYDPDFRATFDWCVASIHDHFDMSAASQTARVLRAMADPSVRMLGHLSARMIGRRPAIDLDFDAIAEAAEASGIVLEVNGGISRLDLPVEWLRRIRGRNIKLVLTSDAHRTKELERVDNSRLNAERAWIEPDQVANALPPAQLLTWVEGKINRAP